MSSVLEKRREFIRLMRRFTLEKGSFTITDIADATHTPRSTVQDWVNRLTDERCVVQKEEQRGRSPARYVTSSAMLSSSCKRIYTTLDGSTVAIYHECRSSGCAAFCAYHHMLAKGILSNISRNGSLLLEYADLGFHDARIGLYPSSAVGILGVRKDGDKIVQQIRCIGGPAYSLTDMMAMAEGVCDVKLQTKGSLVEGEVVTKALEHLIIGIDDTDSPDGGATFALALGLLQFLGKIEGAIPIGHRVIMLNPNLKECTAGNSCSYIELAVEPGIASHISDIAFRFIADESLSPEWGMAIKRGFIIPERLREFGEKARRSIISQEEAQGNASSCGIRLDGGRGVIGALAALSFRGLSYECQLNPEKKIIDDS